jgi:hypothetical protein
MRLRQATTAALIRWPRGVRPRITSRDHLPRRDPEGGRAHQIRAHEQEQLHATLPSVHQSGSGRHLTEGISFSPEAFCDGFVLHGVLARGLQFMPQLLDHGQTLGGIGGHGVLHDGESIGDTQGRRYPCLADKDLRPRPTSGPVSSVRAPDPGSDVLQGLPMMTESGLRNAQQHSKTRLRYQVALDLQHQPPIRFSERSHALKVTVVSVLYVSCIAQGMVAHTSLNRRRGAEQEVRNGVLLYLVGLARAAA